MQNNAKEYNTFPKPLSKMKTCIICIGSNHNPSSNITKAVETLSTLFPDILWGETVVTPAEGVYVAPRAPFDDWNMWFRPEMNDFFRMLIAAAVVEMEVNPDKVYQLSEFGIEITKRVPIQIPATEYDQRYLETKRDRMGHILDF